MNDDPAVLPLQLWSFFLLLLTLLHLLVDLGVRQRIAQRKPPLASLQHLHTLC